MTPQPEPPRRVIAELTALWHELPVSMVRFPAPADWTWRQLLQAHNVLRTAAWNERCSAVSARPCRELPQMRCLQLNRGTCAADVLIPMSPGGGSESWRVATLRLIWRPAARDIQLIAIGATAVQEVGWAMRTLRKELDWQGTPDPGVCLLDDLRLPEARAWRITTVSPWVYDKQPSADGKVSLRLERERASVAPKPVPSPSKQQVGIELCQDLSLRARRLTSLCSADARWQLIGAELVRGLSNEWLPLAIAVDQCQLSAPNLELVERGSNGGEFGLMAFEGYLDITVAAWALPWLSLLPIFGLGTNPDKGYGAVELQPLR